MSDLTVKQWAIVRLIDQGLSRAQIADELDLSVTNVRDTIKVLCDRYGVLQHQLPLAVHEDDERSVTETTGGG